MGDGTEEAFPSRDLRGRRSRYHKRKERLLSVPSQNHSADIVMERECWDEGQVTLLDRAPMVLTESTGPLWAHEVVVKEAGGESKA